jgi:hypothetical protein
MQAARGEPMVMADGEQGEHAGGEGAMDGQMGPQDAVPVLHQAAGAHGLGPGFEEECGGWPPERRQTVEQLGTGGAQDGAALPGPGDDADRRRPGSTLGDARRLFQEESAYLQAKRQARRTRRRMSQHQTGPLPDPAAHALLPLAAKSRLVAMLHATQAERDDLQRRYQALLQEHAQCGVALLTLKATVARYEQFLGRYRRTMQQQEQALDE